MFRPNFRTGYPQIQDYFPLILLRTLLYAKMPASTVKLVSKAINLIFLLLSACTPMAGKKTIII